MTTEDLSMLLKLAREPALQECEVIEGQEPMTGGMSLGVFEVERRGTHGRWAIKVIDDQHLMLNQNKVLNFMTIEKFKAANRRSEPEMHQSLSALRNQYFVPAHAVECINGGDGRNIYLILMPYYCDLTNSRDVRSQNQANPEHMALHVGRDICQALIALHYDDKVVRKDGLGVLVHNDIKPENILYSEDNGVVRFKLGDFGAVQKMGKRCCCYSDGYYAPEVRDDALSQTGSDLFSLGMVLYWCACGMDDKMERQMWQDRRNGKTGSQPPKCDKELWQVILDATESNLDNRICSAEKLLDRLEQVIDKKYQDLQEENARITRTNEKLQKDNEHISEKTEELIRENKQMLEKAEKMLNRLEQVIDIKYQDLQGENARITRTNEKLQKDNEQISEKNEELIRENKQVSEKNDALVVTALVELAALVAGAVRKVLSSNTNRITYGSLKSSYTGESDGSEPHGKGKYKFSDGSTVEGTWETIKGAKLQITEQHLIFYTGMLCNGNPMGLGVLQYANGWRYTGEVCGGVPRGNGKLAFRCDGEERVMDGPWSWVENMAVSRTNGNVLYTGMMKKKKLWGVGICKVRDKYVFDGILQNGEPFVGRTTFPDGTYEEGTYHQAGSVLEITGHGVQGDANGPYFEGQYTEGKKNGPGIYHFKDGTAVEGNWSETEGLEVCLLRREGTYSGTLCDGKPCGKGQIQWKNNGWRYSGEMKDGYPYGVGCAAVFFEGQVFSLDGVWSWAEMTKREDESIYIGMLDDGQPSGLGIFVLPDQRVFMGLSDEDGFVVGELSELDDSCYVGEFAQGERNRQGVMVYPDGSHYKGEWEAGKRCGKGTYTDCAGKTVSGIWKDNQIQRIL